MIKIDNCEEQLDKTDMTRILTVCGCHQQQPEKSICSDCQTSENLRMCVICGIVGCGRSEEGHAVGHWKETEHCFSVDLETRRVWDYARDNYVHCLRKSKTKRKLVMLSSRCLHADGACGSCGCAYSGLSEALLNSRAIDNEFYVQLETQSENDMRYFESLIQHTSNKIDKEISIAVEAVALERSEMSAEMKKIENKINFYRTLNANLLKEIEKSVQQEQRMEKELKEKDDIIKALEEVLHYLQSLRTKKQLEQLSISDDII